MLSPGVWENYTYIDACLDVIEVKVSDNIIHHYIFKGVRAHMGGGQGLSHAQLELPER